MNRIKVLFFANLRDIAGTTEIDYKIPTDTRVEDLKRLISEKYPQLESHIPTTLVSINREFAFDDQIIPDGAEVALFPPVSGGVSSDLPEYLEVTQKEINLNELVQAITLSSTGAVGIFTGVVRAVTTRDELRNTSYLEYEAYKPMADAKLKQVAEEIRTRWPAIEGVAIVQRIGKLFPGTPTVVIACSAPHRDDGVFEAARFGIDRLKEIVPVWKKEVGTKEEEWVEGKYFPTPRD